MQIHSLAGSLARVNYESRARILTSPTAELQFDRQSTIYEQIFKTLESDKCYNRTIYDVKSGIQYSYPEFANWIRRSATAFSDRFVLAGDSILFVGEGSCEYLSLYLGALAVGAVPKTLPVKPKVDFQRLLTECIQHNINILVISESVLKQLPVEKLAGKLKIVSHVIVYNSEGVQNDKFEYEIYENVHPAEDEELYKPKKTNTSPALNVLDSNCSDSYLYSHYSLAALWSMAATSGVFECIAADKALVYGPFEHLENVVMFFTALAATSDIVVQPAFDLKSIITTVTKYQVTIAWFSVNTVLRLLKYSFADEETLSPLLKIITFGGRIRKQFCDEFFKKYTSCKSIRHCFLRPQSPIPISIMELNSKEYDSIGFLLPNTRMKIVTSENSTDPNEPYRVGVFMLQRERDLFAMGRFPAQCSYLESLPFDPLAEMPIINPVLTTNEIYRQRYWLRLSDCGFYDDDSRIFWQGTLFNSKQSLVTRIRNCLYQNEVFDALWSHKKVEDLGLLQLHTHHWIAAIVPTNYTKTILPHLASNLLEHVQEHIKGSSVLGGESSGNKLANIFLGPHLPKTGHGQNLERHIKTDIRDIFHDFLNNRRKY